MLNVHVWYMVYGRRGPETPGPQLPGLFSSFLIVYMFWKVKHFCFFYILFYLIPSSQLELAATSMSRGAWWKQCWERGRHDNHHAHHSDRSQWDCDLRRKTMTNWHWQRSVSCILWPLSHPSAATSCCSVNHDWFANFAALFVGRVPRLGYKIPNPGWKVSQQCCWVMNLMIDTGWRY